MPSQSEAGSGKEVARRVKSILASRKLSLNQASQRSATLFGGSSPYYLPHNLYYDLSHGHFSPSLFQLVAFSRISNYRLRDWLRVFGFDIEAIPRLQIQLASKRTALLESSLDDPNSPIPWFRSVSTETHLAGVVPLSQRVEWTEPRRLGLLRGPSQKGSLYAKIGTEDAIAFPEVLSGSIVRVRPEMADEALKQITAEGSPHFFLIEHGRGFCCCQVRSAGRGRIATVSTQLPYAQMEFRFPEQGRIVGVVDLEIRRMVGQQLPSVARNLAKRWKPEALTPEPTHLGALLSRARHRIGLSFRAAATMSREVANALRDERYFTAAGSLSDYETLNTPPRHFHKVITFCAVYALPLNRVFRALDLSLEEGAQEPIPDLLTGRPQSAEGAAHGVDRIEENGLISELISELGGVPFFLRRSVGEFCGLPRPSLKDFFWIGGSSNLVHPYLTGGLLAVVNRQQKKPSDCGSKPLWQQPLYVVLKRDGTYSCGCCSRENNSLVVHTYTGGVHRRDQFRNRDAEVVGKIVAVARKLI